MCLNTSFIAKLVPLLFFLTIQQQFSCASRVEIRMSNVTTQQEDAYICTSYKLKEYQNYITNIEPLTSPDIAHHMFAFGCDKPASLSKSWNCGNLVCQGSKTILFAWGRNAPALQLPDGLSSCIEFTRYLLINFNLTSFSKRCRFQSGQNDKS